MKTTYQLTGHLGNVLAVVSDKKQYNSTTAYTADLIQADDYYPFGMTIPDRHYSSGEEYRFGFQGQETDDEVNGQGNSIYFKYRVHDPRIGRFASVDPLMRSYPANSPYAFSQNRVIDGVELEGLEYYYTADGKLLGKRGTSQKIRIVENIEIYEQVDDHYQYWNNSYGLLEADDEIKTNVIQAIFSKEVSKSKRNFKWVSTDRLTGAYIVRDNPKRIEINKDHSKTYNFGAFGTKDNLFEIMLNDEYAHLVIILDHEFKHTKNALNNIEDTHHLKHFDVGMDAMEENMNFLMQASPASLDFLLGSVKQHLKAFEVDHVSWGSYGNSDGTGNVQKGTERERVFLYRYNQLSKAISRYNNLINKLEGKTDLEGREFQKHPELRNKDDFYEE